jgi:hypothetical protein
MTDRKQSGGVVLPVTGIGSFTFRKRNVRAEIAINQEYARLTEGVALTGFLETFIRAIAEMKALTIEAPEGYRPSDLDKLNPYDDAAYGRVLKVWHTLIDEREPFNELNKRCREEGRENAGTYEYWFRRTFNLPVTDTRYLDASPEDILTEYWTRHYDDRRLEGKGDEDETIDDDFDLEKVQRLMEEHPDDWEELLDDLDEDAD